MKSVTMFLVLGATLISSNAMADVILQSGSSVGIYARDCSVSPYCTPNGEDNGPLPPLVDGVTNSVSGSGTASIIPSNDPADFPNLGLVSNANGAQSFATAGDTGTFGTPTIDAALYTQDSRVSVGASALQSYTWNGSGPTTRTISGSLTLSESGGWPNNGGSTTAVGMVVFTTGSNVADFTCGDLSFTNSGLCAANATVLSENVFTTTASLTDQTINLNLPSFDLTSPGETIFVLVNSEFFGNGGGYVTDPFTTTISDETGLMPATAPEPSTFALLAAGLASMALLRRRRVGGGRGARGGSSPLA
jgi:hypothetical protein